MELLILIFAWYTGGIIATLGFMLAGMTHDNNLKDANAFMYLYALACCAAWPLTIIQQITTQDDL